MAKKVKCTTGDVFAIPVSETEFIFGRVLFDVTKQYIKIVPEEERELNDLGFFNKRVLVEMFLGEDTNQNYYDMALKHGFDLKRLYGQITGKEKARAKKEKYPQEIMTDVRWAFYGGQYDTIEEFMKAVQEYHEELDADGWQPKEVVLACKEVTVQYAYWDEEDETEEDISD